MLVGSEQLTRRRSTITLPECHVIGCGSNMKRRLVRIGKLALLSVALAGPHATRAVLASDAASPLKSDELYTYIAEKTQILSDARAFYSGKGVLLVLRDGELYVGTWTTGKTGELCWQVDALGDLPCDTYLHEGGGVSVLRDGKIGPAPERQNGMRLKSAEAGSEQSLASAGAQISLPKRELFNRDQTIAFLSGKTSKRAPQGHIYYAPDFTLKTVWNGVHKTGTWSVDKDGGVSWQVAGWGPTPNEYYFYKKDSDSPWALFRGFETPAAEHVEGDQTGSM